MLTRFAFALLGILTFASTVRAQTGGPVGVGVTVDSLHIAHKSMDSLLREDSILEARRELNAARLERTGQLATQREIDLTNDGKPEILRLDGHLDKVFDRTKLTLTIKSGKKLLYKDSWTVGGYFDSIDHLTDSVKIKRLRRIVAVFFANENFAVFDSGDFVSLLKTGTPAEVLPGSKMAAELLSTPRVMLSVYESREYWYGLVWLPSKKKFVKVWRN